MPTLHIISQLQDGIFFCCYLFCLFSSILALLLCSDKSEFSHPTCIFIFLLILLYYFQPMLPQLISQCEYHTLSPRSSLQTLAQAAFNISTQGNHISLLKLHQQRENALPNFLGHYLTTYYPIKYTSYRSYRSNIERSLISTVNHLGNTSDNREISSSYLAVEIFASVMLRLIFI